MRPTLKFNQFKSCKTGMRLLYNCFMMEVRLSVAHTRLKIHIFLCLNMALTGFIRLTQMKRNETASLVMILQLPV